MVSFVYFFNCYCLFVYLYAWHLPTANSKSLTANCWQQIYICIFFFEIFQFWLVFSQKKNIKKLEFLQFWPKIWIQSPNFKFSSNLSQIQIEIWILNWLQDLLFADCFLAANQKYLRFVAANRKPSKTPCIVCKQNLSSRNFFSNFQVSFPAGIVQIVANNPNPAQLSFKIKNADLLESIVPNTKLINPSEMLSTPNGKVFEFKMDALKELLKVQSEINPNAAYFNIDLLKYQVKI